MFHGPDRPRLIAFDLDDTLARSKSPITPEMAKALLELLEVSPILIISGGNVTQFEAQVLAHLGESELLERLHLMPTCGTRYLRHVGGAWTQMYALVLSSEDRTAASEALESEARRLGLWEPDERVHGARIDDRGSQVTFSALGQNAPVDAKKRWDPDGTRRAALRDGVADRLPGLEVRSGGSTSIDVTGKGIDKAYGLARLLGDLALPPTEVLFIGDRLDPGGNDYPVIALGVRTQAVTDEHETLEVIRRLLDSVPVNGRLEGPAERESAPVGEPTASATSEPAGATVGAGVVSAPAPAHSR